MSDQEIKFNAIVATSDENKGIGKDNDLPWWIPEDHHYYLRVVNTTRNPVKTNAVILGRLSWQSLQREARPIGQCVNIVISSSMNQSNIECRDDADRSLILVCRSMNEAKRLVRENYSDKVETIWCLGGAGLYEEAFKSSDFNILYLTRVFGKIDCDVFLRPTNFLDMFRKLETDKLTEDNELYKCHYNVLKKDPDNSLEYIFEVYEKI
jgi:dihydrofolate reductase